MSINARYILIVGASLFLISCDDEAEKEGISFIKFLGIGIVAAITIASIFAIIESLDRKEKRHKQEKQKLIKEAPFIFNKVSDQIKAWIPDCKSILIEEGKKNNAFPEGSPFSRAREKTLKFVKLAHEQIEILYADDISKTIYLAREEIQRILNCCLSCQLRNEKKEIPACLALSQSKGSEIDLKFELKGKGEKK